MLAEKPNCGLFLLFFICILNKRRFVLLFPKLVNCTFSGTQKRKFFWFAWWSTWPNGRFDFLISRIKMKLLHQTSICVFVVKMWLAALSLLYGTLGLPFQCRRSFHARFLKKKKRKKKICHILSVQDLWEHNFPDYSHRIFWFTLLRRDVSHVSLLQLETLVCTCREI